MGRLTQSFLLKLRRPRIRLPRRKPRNHAQQLELIFGLTPTANARWRESVPHQFQGPPDAAFAYNGMVADGSGNFYGATVHGGADGEGAIYKFTPNQKIPLPIATVDSSPQ